MTERHLLAGLIFRLLRPEDAQSAEVDDRLLSIAFRDDSIRVPLRYIRAARLQHQLGRASLIVEHETGSATVSGLAPAEARQLLEAIEHARARWWKTAIANERSTLLALIRSLNYLASPGAYVTRAAFAGLLETARASLQNLTGNWPPVATGSPELAAANRLRGLLEDPEPLRASANKRYLRQELAASGTFFDEIEAQPLTVEQRTAIVTDEQHNLIIAAAGSGKTSVIVAKAAWLVQKGHHAPENLLLLAFARDASNEMKQRMTSRMGTAAPQDLTVSTFHSLGLSIMGEVEARKPSLSAVADSSEALTDLLKSIVSDLLSHPAHQDQLLAWLQNRFAPHKSEHEFETLGEYYAHIRQHDLRTLKGEKVRSFEECEIANYLFLNGVEYEYEAPYEHDTATRQRRQYKPDFHIVEPSIYIEHFALDMQGHTPPFIDRRQYLADRAWKRDLHARNGTVLVETFSHQHQTGTLHRALENALAEHGVKTEPIPPHSIFDILDEQDRIAPFVRLVSTFLANFKSAGLDFHDLADRATASRGRERAEAFISVFRPIHDAYQDTLHRENRIDFHDMIHCAASYVEQGKYRSPYRYILIDEFQDISPARARLLKALVRQTPDNRLFAVGDDWQAISRYTGSDISIMRNFADHFGDHEQLRLETTFRCPDRLAAVATQFILRNPAQIPKTVRSVRKADGPCVHLGLAANPGKPLIDEAIERIREHAATVEDPCTVLVLARYNRTLKPLRPLRRQHPDLHIALKTVHASKGLEADYAIVVGLTSGKYGFPTEIVDDSLLDLVLATPEPHSNAEERRLFYVALTRARRHVYLLADDGSPSAFAKELQHGDYDIALFGRPPAPDVPCPICAEGRMQPRNRPASQELFYGCSNYPYCHHTAPPCPQCKTGIPARSARDMACPNCGHAVTPCPRCPGWLQPRTGPRGPFIGCSSYPACNYSKNLDPDTGDPAPPTPPEPTRSPDAGTPSPPPIAADAETVPDLNPPVQASGPSHPPASNPQSPNAPAATSRPAPPTDPDRPLRIGDAVRFQTRHGTLQGHLADYPPSRRLATVMDSENTVWKVDKNHLTRNAGSPRRTVIITPANEARAGLKIGEYATFSSRKGPQTGQILKLNASRAHVETEDSIWTIPYALFTLNPAVGRRDRPLGAVWPVDFGVDFSRLGRSWGAAARVDDLVRGRGGIS